MSFALFSLAFIWLAGVLFIVHDFRKEGCKLEWRRDWMWILFWPIESLKDVFSSIWRRLSLACVAGSIMALASCSSNEGEFRDSIEEKWNREEVSGKWNIGPFIGFEVGQKRIGLGIIVEVENIPGEK